MGTIIQMAMVTERDCRDMNVDYVYFKYHAIIPSSDDILHKACTLII
jgi:hypothetical protein